MNRLKQVRMIHTKAFEFVKEKTGRDLIAEGWDFDFMNARSAVGRCNHTLKMIMYSKHWAEVNTDESVWDTAIHELSHALNPGDGHGSKWKRTFIMLGGTGNRVAGKSKLGEIEAKWILIRTDTMERVGHYHRKPKRDFSESWIKGKRAETEGKLKLVPYETYITMKHN